MKCPTKVSVGSWVRVRGFVPGIETVFRLVTDSEVDYSQLKLSTAGPLGRALVGAQVGDRVRVHLGDANLELEILDVGCD